MSPGILGKKIGMTQVFRPDGQVVPVTVLKAGPCVVVQRKTPATDGYDAVQLGLMEFVKKTSVNKPQAGHLKKSGAEGVRFQREFRLDEFSGNGDLKPGDRVLVDEFKDTNAIQIDPAAIFGVQQINLVARNFGFSNANNGSNAANGLAPATSMAMSATVFDQLAALGQTARLIGLAPIASAQYQRLDGHGIGGPQQETTHADAANAR